MERKPPTSVHVYCVRVLTNQSDAAFFQLTLEEIREKAIDLFKNRKDRRIPNPFTAYAHRQEHRAGLWPLFQEDALPEDEVLRQNILDSFEASLADSKVTQTVDRYALGRLVTEAYSNLHVSSFLEIKLKPFHKCPKAWSHEKKRALRFYTLCDEFPALVGLEGVPTLCSQEDRFVVVREVFRAEFKKGALDLKKRPEWERPAPMIEFGGSSFQKRPEWERPAPMIEFGGSSFQQQEQERVMGMKSLPLPQFVMGPPPNYYQHGQGQFQLAAPIAVHA
jgi:hypothetical protein